jgi:hypothetical protein
MSEYQYYEFQAVDHVLSDRQMRELRAISTRAVISRTSFSNHYTFGDLKADPRALLTRYFDASLYFANWMFVEVAFRYAKSAVDLASLRRYRAGQSLDIRVKGADVIVALSAEHEAFDPGDDAHGWLASVLPLRAAVAAGDERLLYWGWLLGVQQGDVPDGAREPVRPGELTALTPALEAFADIVGLDPDLKAAAMEGTSPLAEPPPEALERWIGGLDEREHVALLARAAGGDVTVGPALMRRFRQQSRPASPELPLRTAVQLRRRAAELEEARRQVVLARRAKEREAREQAEAAERQRHLARVAKRQADAWRRVDALIATRQPHNYEAAVDLLGDLREIGRRRGREAEATERILALRRTHARKPSFLARLRRAGL